MLMFFFFFKQKTAYEMRISDWSSDVCSSDLAVGQDADFVLQAGEVNGVGLCRLDRDRAAVLENDGDVMVGHESLCMCQESGTSNGLTASPERMSSNARGPSDSGRTWLRIGSSSTSSRATSRSEARRVGNEYVCTCRSRW